MSTHPDGEAQKWVYEQLAAVHLDLATLGAAADRGEFLVELARTLAKGGPYANTVERWARDHGYGQKDPGPGNYGPGQPQPRYRSWPDSEPRMDWPQE